MMADQIRSMPSVLKNLHKLDFLYADGLGIDFEPYAEFSTEEETRKWIRAWTGNRLLEGNEFLVFGQDGTGGLAAFWIIRASVELLDQPVVFFGSEGQTGVVACSFADYLWLLAGGLGPFEATVFPSALRADQPSLHAYAEEHAPLARKSPLAIIEAAHAEFPTFSQLINELCR